MPICAARLLVCVAVGCSTQPDRSESADGASEKLPQAQDGGASAPIDNQREVADAATGAGAEGAPTFTMVYDTILHRFCAQGFCHGGGAVGVNTSSKEAAYQSLVNVMANPMRECAELGLVRVAPGLPEQSLLFLKLDGQNVPCGQQMPVGGELKAEQKLLIEQWIAAGARND